MRVTVLGTGYVGLSTGVCLAAIGHHVTCIDIDEQKIAKLSNGIPPIYEPGLEELLTENLQSGRLSFTTSHADGLKGAEVIIIAVGTPQHPNGHADLAYLEQAARDVGRHITGDALILVKSTVPVGTNSYFQNLLLQHVNPGIEIHFASNPEFLRQGSAIADTLEADRIIIGLDNPQVTRTIIELYHPLDIPIYLTDVKSAEMIKYASNAFLALKISFINEIANLCEAAGANVEDVARGMGKDHRIGSAFLNAGIGYGGSCFPKDVKALLYSSKQNGVPFPLLEETIAINEAQQEILVKKALKRFGSLSGKHIALLGLSFKPGTDDMREAPSVKIARALTSLGATVTAYDPVAAGNAQNILGNLVTYAATAEDAAAGSDALFIVTEWEEFRNLDLEAILSSMKQKIIFDGRNCLKEQSVKSCTQIEYYPIGKPPIVIS